MRHKSKGIKSIKINSTFENLRIFSEVSMLLNTGDDFFKSKWKKKKYIYQKMGKEVIHNRSIHGEFLFFLAAQHLPGLWLLWWKLKKSEHPFPGIWPGLNLGLRYFCQLLWALSTPPCLVLWDTCLLIGHLASLSLFPYTFKKIEEVKLDCPFRSPFPPCPHFCHRCSCFIL